MRDLERHKRVLLVGGAGFIGTHLTNSLSAGGYDVLVYDRQPILAHCDGNSSGSIQSISGDLRDVRAALHATSHADYCVLLAWDRAPFSARRAVEHARCRSVIPICRFLRGIACQQRRPLIIFTSSGGSVYGDTPSGLCSEEIPARPKCDYGMGKLFIERYLGLLRQRSGLHSITLRLANVYGPGQEARRGYGLVPTVMDAMLCGSELALHGGGVDRRDYVFISDVVSAITLVLAKRASHTLYNIGTGHGTTAIEILERLMAVSGITPGVTYSRRSSTEVRDVSLDSRRFEDEFGWLPRVTLERGLEMTWGWRNQAVRQTRARSLRAGRREQWR